MKLVQSQFLPRQATLLKYYALVTGIDCNPYNGPEARATYDTIKNIILEKAVISEEMCIRIYDNEPTFRLSLYDGLGNDVEIQLLLFSVDGNNNGWTDDTLAEAFQKAKVPSLMRQEIGSYSFDWYHEDGTPTFQVHLKDANTGNFVKLDRRHIHISSEPPLDDSIGRVNDYWIIVKHNTLTHWFKFPEGWKDITLQVDSTENDIPPKSNAIAWFKMDKATARRITSDGWDTVRRRISFSNYVEPTDRNMLWWTGPRDDLTAWYLHEYNSSSSKWSPVGLCACVSRDAYTWFGAGKGKTFNVLSATDALSGANISKFPDAGGGAVEIYHLNTSKLIGTAKKLILDADAPEPYLKNAADDTTVHLRAPAGMVTPVNAVYVTNVRPFNEEDGVRVTRDAKGAVLSFESNTPNVIFDVTWVPKQGDFATVPTIGADRADVDIIGTPFGHIATSVVTGTTRVEYGTTFVDVGVTVNAMASPVTKQTITPAIPGQTTFKKDDTGTLVIETSSAMNEIEIVPNAKYSFGRPVYSTADVRVPFTVLSQAESDQFEIEFRVRRSGDFWSARTLSPVVTVDNVAPSFVKLEFVTANRSAVRPGETYQLKATMKNAVGDIIPSIVELPAGTSGTISDIVQGLDGQTVTFKINMAATTGSTVSIGLLNTKESNNSRVAASPTIPVVTVAPTITSTTTPNVRLGETKTINVEFSQDVLVESVSEDNTDITVTTGHLARVGNKNSVGLTADKDATLSDGGWNLTWKVTGPSGIKVDLVQEFTVRGFTKKTLTLVYPALSVIIGPNEKVIDLNKLVVSGKINSSPAFAICNTRDEETVDYTVRPYPLAGHYKITDGGTKIEVSPAVKSFNYSATNNITIDIEETD